MHLLHNVVLSFIFFFPIYSLAQKCRVLPTDPTWPSDDVWNSFNKSVEGRLIRTVPIASPCHNPTFDAEKCASIQDNWHDAAFHDQSSSSVTSAVFANRSCDPFGGPNSTCIIGTYVEYAVNASTADHVSATVKFARHHNIRFVVRNSAHDYMGKSTGHGALAVWMHHLTKTKWMDSYSSSTYRGPAVKAHAGVSVRQMYEEASAHGYAIVGGACPTVGYAGGFIQGGGHGPLSSIYGLAADDTLSFQVITTDGSMVHASRTEHSHLFWALSGGGGGSYGIVFSVTVKVHPDTPVTGAVVIFSTSDAVTLDAWWDGVDAYRNLVPNITAAGGYSLATYLKGYFQIWPMLLPNKTADDATQILQPFLASLTARGIPFNSTITTYPGFLQAYNSAFNTSDFAIANAQIGGRLLPKSSWRSASSLRRLNAAIRHIVDDGGGAFDIAVTPSQTVGGHPDNAVFPPWREAQATLSIFLPWDDHGTAAEAHKQQVKITTLYMEALKQVTPQSGAYLNEADAFDPDWRETFYGVNYDRLLRIKDKWDPAQMLYGSTAVGGDRWAQRRDGRFCRT